MKEREQVMNKIALVVTKIVEIGYWIATVLMGMLLIFAVFIPENLDSMIKDHLNPQDALLSCGGFEISMVDKQGNMMLSAIIVFAITAFILLGLYAMIFRNANLILKTAKGKTWFSKGDTPFQNDIVRMLREIGIFLIAIPIVSLLSSIIAKVVIGQNVETSVTLEHIVVGLLMLCLSQFFVYGTKLQEDVDGLV